VSRICSFNCPIVLGLFPVHFWFQVSTEKVILAQRVSGDLAGKAMSQKYEMMQRVSGDLAGKAMSQKYEMMRPRSMGLK